MQRMQQHNISNQYSFFLLPVLNQTGLAGWQFTEVRWALELVSAEVRSRRLEEEEEEEVRRDALLGENE